MKKVKNKMAVDLLFEQQEAEAENVLRGKITAWFLFGAVLIGAATMIMSDAKASTEVMPISQDSLVDQWGNE